MTQLNLQTGPQRANPQSSAINPSSYDEMEWATYQEHRYQARLTYVLSCVAITASIGLSLSAGLLVLLGNATQASVTAVTGLVSTGLYIPLSRDANRKIERLRRLTKDYKAHRPSIKA